MKASRFERRRDGGVPRRSLKMLRGSLAPSGYRPQTTSLSRSPMTLAALRLSSGTPTSARRSSTQLACFPSSTVVKHTKKKRRKKEKETLDKVTLLYSRSSASLRGNILVHCSYIACSGMDTMEMDNTCLQGGEGMHRSWRYAPPPSLLPPRRRARASPAWDHGERPTQWWLTLPCPNPRARA